MTNQTKMMAGASALVLALVSQPALAEGTTAGAQITNTVSVNYKVNGMDQTATTASDTLTVDRKVNVLVAEIGNTTTQVSPGQSAAVTTFQVTNLSNATLDFALALSQQAGGNGAHSNTDNFNASNLRIYRDSNNNGTFDAGDSQVTYLDEVAADANIRVFAVVDIPLGRATGDVAAVTLTATAREGGAAGTPGAALVQTAGPNTTSMDTVFADGAGAADGQYDAAYSAKDDYTVLAAALSVVKTSKLISDPVNGSTDPKFIPGAVVEYCIAVSNASGSATATSVAIDDPLPASMAYLSGFGILVNGTVNGSNQCLADGAAGGSYASGTVSATLPSVTAAETRTVVFRATIN